MLSKLIPAKLTTTPNANGTEVVIVGAGAIELLLTSVAPFSEAVVTPAGFEPAISTLKGSRPRPD